MRPGTVARVALVAAVSALSLAGLALLEVNRIGGSIHAVPEAVTNSDAAPGAPQTITDSGREYQPAPTLVPVSHTNTPPDTSLPTPIQVGETWNVSYRENEEVVDIGERIDVDGTDFVESSDEVVELGMFVDPDI